MIEIKVNLAQLPRVAEPELQYLRGLLDAAPWPGQTFSQRHKVQSHSANPYGTIPFL